MAARTRPTEVATAVAGMVADQTSTRSKDVTGGAARRRDHHPTTGHGGHHIPNLSHRTTVRRPPDAHTEPHVSVVAVSLVCR